MYLITIRKSQVKDYVTKEQLDSVLYYVINQNKNGIKWKHLVETTGYHLHGKYRQLHMHALIFMPIITNFITQIRGFRVYWKQIDEDEDSFNKAHKYCHNEDHWNEVKLQQILVENDAKHLYLRN